MLLALLAAAALQQPSVRIFADDTLAAPIAFTALSAELRIDGGAPRVPRPITKGDAAAPGELRVTKRADAVTTLLASHATTGRRLAAVLVEIPGPSGAADTMRVRLAGATIASARLVMPAASADVPSQRLAQEVAVSQLAADREEAARQLAEAVAVAKVESRGADRLVPANALARARDAVQLLDVRLAAARRQLALFEERVAAAATPTEELVLRAERVEILRAPSR